MILVLPDYAALNGLYSSSGFCPITVTPKGIPPTDSATGRPLYSAKSGSDDDIGGIGDAPITSQCACLKSPSRKEANHWQSPHSFTYKISTLSTPLAPWIAPRNFFGSGTRGDSNAMMVWFWDSITDCCARLMPSSNSNRNIVATASIITPKNTQAVGSSHKWPARQASQIIPPPTNRPPITAAEINTKCGVEGSTPPEKNWPIYVEIAAPFVLILFGFGFAAIAVIRWLLSLIRSKE